MSEWEVCRVDVGRSKSRAYVRGLLPSDHPGQSASPLVHSRYIRYDAAYAIANTIKPASCLVPSAASLLRRLLHLRPIDGSDGSWPDSDRARGAYPRGGQ